MFGFAQFKIEVLFSPRERTMAGEARTGTVKLTEKSMKMQYFFVTKTCKEKIKK